VNLKILDVLFEPNWWITMCGIVSVQMFSDDGWLLRSLLSALFLAGV
jgi:hypothetical protein